MPQSCIADNSITLSYVVLIIVVAVALDGVLDLLHGEGLFSKRSRAGDVTVYVALITK